MPASGWRTTLGLLIVAVLVSYTPSFAGESEEAGTQTTTTASHSDGRIRLSLPAAFDEPSQSQLPQGRVVHHCCNPEGATIGAAIGAAAGWLFTQHFCDAGDCSGDYIKSMAVLGGIGALVGAFADRHNTVPIASPDRRFRVSAVVTPRTRQALATSAF